MKLRSYLFTASALLTLSSQALAGEYVVTPATLGDWQLSGAKPADTGEGPTLSLPAGATLARTFELDAVLVHAYSSPTFVAVPADWPILQVGPAALALVRNGNQGELVLLVDNIARALPFGVTVDAAGHGIASVELAIGYSPASHRGIVMFNGKTEEFSASASGASEVVLSAGESRPWPFESLTAVTLDAPVAPSIAGNSLRTSPTSNSAGLQASADIVRRMEAAWFASEQARQSGAGSTGMETNPMASAVALEIFTPPAVRNDPASIRREIARQKKL